MHLNVGMINVFVATLKRRFFDVRIKEFSKKCQENAFFRYLTSWHKNNRIKPLKKHPVSTER